MPEHVASFMPPFWVRVATCSMACSPRGFVSNVILGCAKAHVDLRHLRPTARDP